MPHIRDPVTHRCVVCQLGRHPSPFPIGWRSGGLPHKCHHWERFERRRRADARERYRRQVGSTAYTGPVVLDFDPPQVAYPSLDYDENFGPVETDDVQQLEVASRRRGGLRQSEPGTASLDQYHFFNDPLISRTRRSYAVVAVNQSAPPQVPNNGGNRNVTFSEPPAIAVTGEVEGGDDFGRSGGSGDHRGAEDGLSARFHRRQTRGAFSREEFGRAVESQDSGSRERSQFLVQQQHQQPNVQRQHQEAAAFSREADGTGSSSSTCEIL